MQSLSPGAVWGCCLPREMQLGFILGFFDLIQWLVGQKISRNLNVNAMQRPKGREFQITAGQGLFEGSECWEGCQSFNTSVLTAGSYFCAPEKLKQGAAIP